MARPEVTGRATLEGAAPEGAPETGGPPLPGPVTNHAPLKSDAKTSPHPPRPPSTGPPPRLAYSIDEFCLAVGISRFTYYKMKKDGTGPREMRIGDRGFVSVEAAREWCERRTQPAIA
jgi:predicted DNA-binding transcriptional regulator AlpA